MSERIRSGEGVVVGVVVVVVVVVQVLVGCCSATVDQMERDRRKRSRRKRSEREPPEPERQVRQRLTKRNTREICSMRMYRRVCRRVSRAVQPRERGTRGGGSRARPATEQPGWETPNQPRADLVEAGMQQSTRRVLVEPVCLLTLDS